MSKGRYFCGGSALAVTLALVGATHAMAQSAADIQKAFTDADKNKDGKLDAAEFGTLPQAIRDKAVDANGDGSYILAELTPTQSAEAVTEVRAIVSTGTYLKSGAEDTALNIEAQSRDDLLKSGSPTMESLIRNLSESGLNENGDNRGQNSQGYGVRTINLRNLGAGRTLILFDGVRLADDPQTNGGPAITRDPNVQGGGAQNVNNIPMEVLATVEILKDGGSAAYGGDAAGGAVNFTPRRDLNGFEMSTSYQYIADTDGVYDANIQWGKRQGNQNFLFSAYYQHVSPLSGADRDFIKRSFIQNQYNFGWGPWDPDLLSMAFATPGLPNVANASNAFAVGSYGIANPVIVSGAGVTKPAQDAERGILRDDLCLEMGGGRGFITNRVPVGSGLQTNLPLSGFFTLATPACLFAKYKVGNLKEDTDTYRVFADATVNMTDNLRWHNSVTFSKSQTTVADLTIQEANACDPWPTNAPSYTTATTGSGTTPSRECLAPGISNLDRQLYPTTSAGLQAGPTVPGYNPAVRDYLLRYYANSPLGSDTNGARVFSDTEINKITGCVVPNGSSTTQWVVSTVANSFNCNGSGNPSTASFVSDIPVLTGRSYLAASGTVANGFFTPGTASTVGTTPTNNVAIVQGPTLGQGYTPTYGNTMLTVNIGTSAAPVNIALQLNQGAQVSGVNVGTQTCLRGSTAGVTTACLPTFLNTFGTPSTVSGVLTQGTASFTLPAGGGQPGGYGKVLLPNAVYAPFVSMYNSAFRDSKGPFFNSQNSSLAIGQDIKGDLGEHMGNALDFTLRANYSRQINRQVGAQMMADRFQRALDGFATDLNDLGPDALGCTTTETQGTRVLQTAPGVFTSVTGVPFTVGGGGGTDYAPTTAGIQDADFGFDPGVSKGNRCFFFNPFDSAIRVSKLNGNSVAADNGTPGFVGANTPSAAGGSTGPGTAIGALGDYQGYGNDMGLENSPGVLGWIYQKRETRSQLDRILLQGILNGEFTKFQLPGGPIDWDIVLQYTYQNRDAFTDPIGNRDINPCPFMRTTVPRYNAVQNLVNATSTCGADSNRQGLFATANSTTVVAANPLTTGFNSGPIGGGFQQLVTHSAVVEWNLPFVRRALLHNTIRFEESRGQNDKAFHGGTIYSTDLKWQAFDNLAFTGNIGMNFDNPITQLPGQTLTLARNVTDTNAWWTGTTRAQVNINSQSTTWINTALGPERGTNYSVGAIFQTRDRASQVRLVFFSDRIGGSVTTLVDRQAIARVLTKNRIRGTDLDITAPIDCADPALQPFFGPGGSNGLFEDLPFVQFSNGTDVYRCGDNSLSGGPNITTFTLAGFDADGNGSELDEGVDFGLALNVPNQINSGVLIRSGIELGANHRIKSMIYGGTVNLTADLTWNLKNRSTDIFYYGSLVASGTDNIGTLNDGFSNFANIWGGNLGLNYNHGKHNVRLTWRWQSSVVDNSGLGLAAASTPVLGGIYSNLNPLDNTTCNTAQGGLGIPFVPQPHTNEQITNIVGDVLVGEQGFNLNCVIGDLNGYKVHGQAIGAVTYRVELPADTTLTVSVDNILGTAPAFARFIDNYNPFAAMGPDGRTVKVQVQKKF